MESCCGGLLCDKVRLPDSVFWVRRMEVSSMIDALQQFAARVAVPQISQSLWRVLVEHGMHADGCFPCPHLQRDLQESTT
jgi:hypothetical protein